MQPVHRRFPALNTGCMSLLYDMIGSLDCGRLMRFRWLGFITFDWKSELLLNHFYHAASTGHSYQFLVFKGVKISRRSHVHFSHIPVKLKLYCFVMSWSWLDHALSGELPSLVIYIESYYYYHYYYYYYYYYYYVLKINIEWHKVKPPSSCTRYFNRLIST